ncbi:Hypothetical predicted protein [Mytilus galloprovincialis]|uniref:Mab-21-like nucleotidyltransferase domain-containing protein n=1 Tax=Mytilus galloprovincialis TaxID=29158 RepID=A0A8B6HM67_MYTGA|nr:Hypothetical predicted protein [Mytilus galloprovincialis]
MDRQLSLKIFQNLCNIFGTEEVVKTRRTIFCVIDSVLQITDSTVVSSGSRAEGLDLKDSDYDQMFVETLFQVYENKSKVSFFENKIPLIMDITDTKPGFTKLKLNNPRYKDILNINQWVKMVQGEAYISSKLFREHDLQHFMISHGLSQSIPDGTYDSVRSFRCKEWITPVHQWFFRSRSSWPDHRLVPSVIEYGVLFVPIGCKESLKEDLEWRISFAMAEKQLIFPFLIPTCYVTH